MLKAATGKSLVLGQLPPRKVAPWIIAPQIIAPRIIVLEENCPPGQFPPRIIAPSPLENCPLTIKFPTT